jgi:hypothetical protein
LVLALRAISGPPTWNETIRAYEKPSELATVDRAEAGVPELSFCGFALLNDMVDWRYLHDRVVARHTVRP